MLKISDPQEKDFDSLWESIGNGVRSRIQSKIGVKLMKYLQPTDLTRFLDYSKRRQVGKWRKEIENPGCPIGMSLIPWQLSPHRTGRIRRDWKDLTYLNFTTWYLKYSGKRIQYCDGWLLDVFCSYHHCSKWRIYKKIGVPIPSYSDSYVYYSGPNDVSCLILSSVELNVSPNPEIRLHTTGRLRFYSVLDLKRWSIFWLLLTTQ